MRQDKAKDLDFVSFEELKKIKLKDLRIFHPADHIIIAFNEVLKELKDRQISIKPQIWVSDEWFCPDGTAGIGVPFYLSSKRLTEIEKREVGFVEGHTILSAKKMIRHELGHVVDNLFHLRRNKERREIFGKSSIKYPTRYFYKPYSQNYVRHLSEGYAQCHPAEDFAETFAIWLDPKSNWKKRYQNWGCIKKLEYIDKKMMELRHIRPSRYDQNKYYQLEDINKTYGKYLSERRKKFNTFDHFWNDLKGDFLSSKNKRTKLTATCFIRDYSPEIIKRVSKKTGYPKYLVKNMILDIKRNVQGENIGSSVLSSKEIMSYHITKKVNDFINEGRHLTRL